jgi:hypothetical protein
MLLSIPLIPIGRVSSLDLFQIPTIVFHHHESELVTSQHLFTSIILWLHFHHAVQAVLAHKLIFLALVHLLR